MPFKWNNVQAPDFTGAANILQAGGNNLNEAINTLSNVAKNLNQQQIDAQKASLVQQALANASDPEQLNNFFKSASSNPAFNKLTSADWIQAQQFQNDLLNTNKLQGEVADANWARESKKALIDLTAQAKLAQANGDIASYNRINNQIANLVQEQNLDPTQAYMLNTIEDKLNLANLNNAYLRNKQIAQSLEDETRQNDIYAKVAEISTHDPTTKNMEFYELTKGLSPKEVKYAYDAAARFNITPESTILPDIEFVKDEFASKFGSKIISEEEINRAEKVYQNATGSVDNLPKGLYGNSVADPTQYVKQMLSTGNTYTINMSDGSKIPLNADTIDDFDITQDNKGNIVFKYNINTIENKLSDLVRNSKDKYLTNADDIINAFSDTSALYNLANALEASNKSKLAALNPTGLPSDFNKTLEDFSKASSLSDASGLVLNKFKKNTDEYGDLELEDIAPKLQKLRKMIKDPDVRANVTDGMLATFLYYSADPDHLMPFVDEPTFNVDKAYDLFTAYMQGTQPSSNKTMQEEYERNISLINQYKEAYTNSKSTISDLNKKLKNTSDETTARLLEIAIEKENAKMVNAILSLYSLGDVLDVQRNSK